MQLYHDWSVVLAGHVEDAVSGLACLNTNLREIETDLPDRIE